LVPPVAITLILFVLLEPLPVVLRRVLPVLLTLTAKSVPQLLVRIWFVPLVLTRVVRQRVFHVPVAPTKNKLAKLENPLANHVVLGNTKTKLENPLAYKTFVLVPMVLHQRAQHVPPTVPIFVCLVTVDNTKLATRVRHANKGNTKWPTISTVHHVNFVRLGNTTTKLVKRLNQLLVKVVHQAPTKLKVAKPRVIHVPPVPTVA